MSALKKHWPELVFFGLLALFPTLYSLATGTALTAGPAKFWQGQFIAFFILAVYSMSYDLLLGYTGILSFGHAAFFGGGAYTMALFLEHVMPGILKSYRITLPGGFDMTEGVLFAVGVGLVLLVSAGLGLLYSATSARVKGAYFAMITLAIGDTLHILSKATDFVEWTGADEGLQGIYVPDWLNPTQHRLEFYFLTLGFLVLAYVVLRHIVNSPTGRVFVALRENENRVRSIGFNPATYRTLAFVISALAAGIAGALYAIWNGSATPSLTSTLFTINALIMTILGGVGTLIGPVLGTAVMQIFSQFFYQWFGPRWPMVFGLIFIALVMFFPYGLVGTWQSQANWRTVWKKRLISWLKPKS